MTAFSFILGVIPLVIATGAGAASRVSLGYAVMGGMIAATIVGTCLVPVFYVMLQSLREKVKDVALNTLQQKSLIYQAFLLFLNRDYDLSSSSVILTKLSSSYCIW